MVLPWKPTKAQFRSVNYIKGFHMPSSKACAYRKKGMMLLLRGFARVQFIRGCVGLVQELV